MAKPPQASWPYDRDTPYCTTEEMLETLEYLTALIPADAPAVHQERLQAIRVRVPHLNALLICGDPPPNALNHGEEA